jgi:hypothetical protein
MIDELLKSLAANLASEIGKQLRSVDFISELAKAIRSELAVEIPPEQQTYTVRQLEKLCAENGIRVCSAFTLNKKCRDGRIKATKAANGKDWLIDTVEARKIKAGG